MHTVKKSETVFVTARGKYVVDGIIDCGYPVVRPYKDKRFWGRVAREVWFRLHFPESIWYTKRIKNMSPKNIIIQDTLITKKYIEWIKKS